MKKSVKIIKKMQHPSGLFSAASSQKTGYHRAWIRDNVYSAMGLESQDIKSAIKAYHALLKIFLKHEYKIDWAIKEKPDARYKYIHARYDPKTLEEIWEEWGNKQNDAIGAFLFKIGTLEKSGIKILRNINDFRIIQKLVFYLGRLEYWHDKDNGMWEENEEIHASSVGACLAGLIAVKDLIYVPEDYINKGKKALNQLLPRESTTKEVDLALLSLIYPYNIVTEEQAKAIIENVENILVREKGAIRYIGDQYYSNGSEANWVFGFPWLAIIHKKLGNSEKHKHYVAKTTEVMNDKGELPELYFDGTSEHNENTPLAWAHAMHILAVE